MTTGVITSEPSPDWRGDALTVDVASGETVLYVKETLDFDEDDTRTRWLVVGESEPLEYVSVDEDAGTVTLADPTTEDYEAGLPVVLWDPTAGAKVVEYLAPVRLSDNSGTVDAVLPHELIPLNGIDNLRGASVSLVESNGDWFVGQVFARKAELATITGTTVQTGDEGQRVVITNFLNNGLVLLYTGNASEAEPAGGDLGGPGYIASGSTDFGSGAVLQTIVSGPRVEGEPDAPMLLLVSDEATGGGSADTYAQVIADRLTMNGELEVTSLADGGSQNQNSGTKYVRAGAGGSIFSSNLAPSSRTVKHDIQPLDLDPAALLELRPVTFRYNEDPGTVRVGFIAEEARDLGLGPLVGYEDREDPDRVTGFDYDGVSAALLLVVQRQEARIVALEARLAGGAEDTSHSD